MWSMDVHGGVGLANLVQNEATRSPGFSKTWGVWDTHHVPLFSEEMDDEAANLWLPYFQKKKSKEDL